MIGHISASNQLRTSSELAPNMFGASSELASVMEFGLYPTVILIFRSTALHVHNTVEIMTWLVRFISIFVQQILEKVTVHVGGSVSGRPFVKRFNCLMLSDRYPVCLSCNVRVWPNGWIDQDATCYGDRPWPRRHCITWVPSSPTERGTAAPTFRLTLLWHGRPFQQLLSSCFA